MLLCCMAKGVVEKRVGAIIVDAESNGLLVGVRGQLAGGSSFLGIVRQMGQITQRPSTVPERGGAMHGGLG
jgi:hypothetical protein